MVRLCWFADSHSRRLGGAEGEKLRAYRLWVKKRLDKAHKDVPPTPHPVLNPLEALPHIARPCVHILSPAAASARAFQRVGRKDDAQLRQSASHGYHGLLGAGMR